MTDYQLAVKSRDVEATKAKKLLKEGIVPGVIYGRGIKNQNISVDEKDMVKAYDEAGESTLIDLKIEDQEPVKVMIKEVQREPIQGRLTHVDFRQVRMDEKITAEVDLEFVGEAPAVKELGGTLIKNYSYLEIECLPKDLISKITVDISALKTFDDVIRIKDLDIPESVKVFQDQERGIAVVAPPMSEKELEELEKAPETGVEDVEVAEKGKAAEEEGEAAEEGAEEGKEEKKPEEGKAEDKGDKKE